MGELHEPDEVGHGATRQPPQAVPPVPGGNGGGKGGRVFASPLARRIAADQGINLSDVQGSGPGGRVVQRDVLAARSGKGAAGKSARPATSAAPRVPRGQKQVIPLTKMRSAIAVALQRSKQNIPHFYETVDVDVEAVSALRARINQRLEAEKVKLSLADFISMAVCRTLLQHPEVNATFDEKKNEITRHGDVNLGIAVAVPDGLIVPVLRAADQMPLRELRQRSADLIDRARAQRLKQDEMTGGTFTITSLGTFGVREFSAIINPPQVAILAVGAAEPRAVVRDGHVVARTMMTVTLSADHRVVDGAVAAEFLRTLKGMLEEPAMMVMDLLVG
jgi:pyruvate dehydrogenase E2 component (dihydrolipoamide acetyltransferase)